MLNFCYMIGDIKTKEAMIVDPAWGSEKILSLVESEGFKLTGLLVSHAHYDHTNAIQDIRLKTDIPVYAHPEEIKYAQSGEAIVGHLGHSLKPVSGGDSLLLGETEIKFLHTPGHTPGSQCIEVGHSLLTGDTLFIGGCGRSDLPGGNPEILYESLRKIARLPSHLEIYPGHDYGTAPKKLLEEETKENPFLQMTDRNQFVQSVA